MQDTSWERITLTPDAKKQIYKFEGSKYSLSDHRLPGVREELLSDEYLVGGCGKKPLWMLDDIARPLFIDMPMFFVKVCLPWFLACSSNADMNIALWVLVHCANFPALAWHWVGCQLPRAAPSSRNTQMETRACDRSRFQVLPPSKILQRWNLRQTGCHKACKAHDFPRGIEQRPKLTTPVRPPVPISECKQLSLYLCW